MCFCLRTPHLLCIVYWLTWNLGQQHELSNSCLNDAYLTNVIFSVRHIITALHLGAPASTSALHLGAILNSEITKKTHKNMEND